MLMYSSVRIHCIVLVAFYTVGPSGSAAVPGQVKCSHCMRVALRCRLRATRAEGSGGAQVLVWVLALIAGHRIDACLPWLPWAARGERTNSNGRSGREGGQGGQALEQSRGERSVCVFVDGATQEHDDSRKSVGGCNTCACMSIDGRVLFVLLTSDLLRLDCPPLLLLPTSAMVSAYGSCFTGEGWCATALSFGWAETDPCCPLVRFTTRPLLDL